MSKALDALQKIKLKPMRNYDGSIGMNGNVMFEEEIPVIETALKDAEKYKRALEIIKEKEVNIFHFKYAVRCEEEDGLADGFEIYNLNVLLKDEITREEYEFLKEFLT